MHETSFTIPVTAPFRLDLTVWVLRRRARNAIDSWNGQSYSRILILGDTPAKLTIAQNNTLKLTVSLQSFEQLSSLQQAEARNIIKKVLGLKVDVQPFYAIAERDPVLQQLVQPFIGVRPPRFPTVFEALINAIACQQVSLDVGILLLNRLSEKFGLKFADGSSLLHAFPRAEELFDAPEAHFRQLGFSHQKTRAIKELAYSVASGQLRLEQLEGASNEQARAQLQTIHGIGRWSAEYALLRGLGRLDIFPGDDVGGQNNVQKLLGLETRPAYEQLQDLTATWHPYAGLVYFHMLLNKLHAKGLV
jgi:DNA-3-methyladenine glycosylase II